MKYRDGILLGAAPETIAKNRLLRGAVKRFTQIGDNAVFCTSGDFSDFQKVSEKLKQKWEQQKVYQNKKRVDVEFYANLLASKFYKKRNQVDPYFLESVFCGVQQDRPRLFYIDLYGSIFETDYVATSLARPLCAPIIDQIWRPDLELE